MNFINPGKITTYDFVPDLWSVDCYIKSVGP